MLDSLIHYGCQEADAGQGMADSTMEPGKARDSSEMNWQQDMSDTAGEVSGSAGFERPADEEISVLCTQASHRRREYITQ